MVYIVIFTIKRKIIFKKKTFPNGLSVDVTSVRGRPIRTVGVTRSRPPGCSHVLLGSIS